MTPRSLKSVGALFLSIGALTLLLRILGGTEFALLPWPVSLIVIAIGAFFLKLGADGERSTRGTRNDSRSS